MDARSFRPVVGVASLLLLLFASQAEAQFGRSRQFTANSTNFIVFASSPEWAAQVAEMAELNRRELALHWLGHELPAWTERVPIHVEAGPHLGAGGETRFSLLGGNRIGQWMMSVSGTQERILDSVLPHEITHTIFATHFAPLGKYVPRWADEGACTTVEHVSEKKKHQDHLKLFLQNRRGLAFNQMFQLKEYPADIMPLYAQGHSAVQFLIDQGGAQKFVKFLETGMQSEDWNAALQAYYAYDTIGNFQTNWNQWLADGSPADLLAYAPGLQRADAGKSSSEVGSEVGSVALASSVRQGPRRASPTIPPATDVAFQSASIGTSAVNTELPPLGNESWYKRRLREVSGQHPPLNAPAVPPKADSVAADSFAESTRVGVIGVASESTAGDNVANGAPAPALRPQAVGRTPAAESVGIQVLDWGDSVPVPGIQPGLRAASTVDAGTPVYR